MMTDEMLLGVILAGVASLAFGSFYASLNSSDAVLFIIALVGVLSFSACIIWDKKSKYGRDKKKRLETVLEIPSQLLCGADGSIKMGMEADLGIPIFLTDSIRSRHVHILGATGSGKTESVILNFLKQDIERGLGGIILDAKGDTSFLASLNDWVPKSRLRVFDLGGEDSLSYDPLEDGSPLESAQRLFSSLTWSEEYYKSKAFSSLQRLFQNHFEIHGRNPKLKDLSDYLEDSETFTAFTNSTVYSKKLAERDFMELSGLRDQIKILCTGHLERILSPKEKSQMKLEEAKEGTLLYFRLQSLLSAQLVGVVGKLLISHLNFLVGMAHRQIGAQRETKLIPTYLDEFASFACPEFADLISKARSAGIALHFSHQSIGDLEEVSKGFINRITDNSATKIVLRINDPDSAEFFARSFGTKLVQKVTQRVTGAKDIELAEAEGEGSQREVHQFRAAPDLFKTLPTGMGSVLVAHGFETPHGASTVFKIKFPKLEKGAPLP